LGLSGLIIKYKKAFNFILLLSYSTFQLITILIDHIISTATTRGGILIFLPGVSEIKQCIDSILRDSRQKDMTVLPLHANLSNDEQRRVFEKAMTWKIIAATNVAEVCDFLSGLPSLPAERFFRRRPLRLMT
jgi:Helicase conserved C-terminal domain